MNLLDRVERFLRRAGVLSPFTEDDMINASTEDKLREHQSLVQKAQNALHARLAANEQLRNSIRIASQRTDEFADFENGMRHRREESHG